MSWVFDFNFFVALEVQPISMSNNYSTSFWLIFLYILAWHSYQSSEIIVTFKFWGFNTSNLIFFVKNLSNKQTRFPFLLIIVACILVKVSIVIMFFKYGSSSDLVCSRNLKRTVTLCSCVYMTV